MGIASEMQDLIISAFCHTLEKLDFFRELPKIGNFMANK
jgi:hypothetical protein